MLNMERDHWNIDRSDEQVMAFAHDTLAIAAFKFFLGIDEDVQVNEMNMEQVFGAMKYDQQITILENYIEEVGMQAEFDQWYEVRYCEDADEDWDGMSDDEIDFPIWGTAGRCEL